MVTPVVRIVTVSTLLLTTGCSLVNPHVFQRRFDETPRLGGAVHTEEGRERARKVSERMRTEINAERQRLETRKKALDDTLTNGEESLQGDRRRADQGLNDVRANIGALQASQRTLAAQRADLERKLATTTTQIAELAKAKKDTKPAEQKKQELEADLRRIEDEARSLEGAIASEQVRESQHLDSLFALNQQREQVMREVATLDQALRARAARLAALDALESAEQREIVPAEAYAYSGEVKQRYREALGDQARLQSWLGLGLIPLSAAAIGLGATGADPSAILALGLTGATGFGVGQWLLNKPRQLAYVAGLKALTCAEDAVAPLVVPVTVRADFRADRDALDRALQDLQEQVGIVRLRADVADVIATEFTDSTDAPVKKSADGLKALVASARARLGEVASTVSSAEEALKSGAKLETAFGQAGRTLVWAVNRIADEVDGIIVETQRDLQALSTIIGGLGSTYQTFTTVPSALKPQDKTRAGEFFTQGLEKVQPTVREAEARVQALRRLEQVRAELTSALIILESRTAAVSAATRRVADRVNAVVTDAPFERLKRDCGVKSDGIFTALTIDPAGPFQAEQKKASTFSFVIKGGLTPYDLSQVIPAGKGVEAVKDQAFGSGVTVTVSDKAEPGSYAFRVYDSASPRQTKDVTIVVAPAPDKPDTPKQDAKLKELVDALLDQEVEVGGVKFKVDTVKPVDDSVEVQLKIVGPKPDKRTSDITEPLVKTALVNKVKPGRDPKVIKIKNWSDLESALPPAATAPGADKSLPADKGKPTAKPAEPLFDKLDEPQRKRLQGALCLKGADVDGVWGPRTIEALKKFQESKKETPTGRLTPALRDELLKMTEAERNKRCDVGG